MRVNLQLMSTNIYPGHQLLLDRFRSTKVSYRTYLRLIRREKT